MIEIKNLNKIYLKGKKKYGSCVKQHKPKN